MYSLLQSLHYKASITKHHFKASITKHPLQNIDYNGKPSVLNPWQTVHGGWFLAKLHLYGFCCPRFACRKGGGFPGAASFATLHQLEALVAVSTCQRAKRAGTFGLWGKHFGYIRWISLGNQRSGARSAPGFRGFG